MIKKLFLIIPSLLLIGKVFAQPNLDPQKGRTCATEVPSLEWQTSFNEAVERYKASLSANKAQPAPWTIPVVVHIIHNGQAVGVGDNISQAQVIDQINILNADMAGTGLNVGNAPAAFVPVIANTPISFCLAVKDPTGGILPEPGIDRIDRNSKGWNNGPYNTAYVNGTIKPATIWDPTRYCNMWVCNLGGGLLGYATFPAGTSLTGVAGGGNATNDGVVMLNTSFGSIGSATTPPYHKGRTTTHEIGHWLGLIHTWGDDNGACTGNDFCNDTPNSANSVFGCPATPTTDACSSTAPGVMTMNFMDYTDDLCMYMFTNDQKTRMMTAMTQGTYRSQLGTHGLCSVGPPPPPPIPGPAVSSFALGGKPCIGQSFIPIDKSTGDNPLTYAWASSPATASFAPNNTVPTPSITFTAGGTYTLTLVVTNTAGTSSSSTVINVGKCPRCLDTAKIFLTTDTLRSYNAMNDQAVIGCQSGNPGFFTGTNCYGDKEFAQYISPNSYSDTPTPQVHAVIVLFDSLGTKATAGTLATPITCKIYGGNATSGPQAFMTDRTDSLGKIAASTKTTTIKFLGSPTYTIMATKIIPFKFVLSNPVAIGANGFYVGVTTPFNSPLDSIKIFTSTRYTTINDSSAWVFTGSNSWKTLKKHRNSKVRMAYVPLVSCRPIVGINENTNKLESNVDIFPNPNNGEFNIAFTFNETVKCNVITYNAIGQVIGDNKLENVSNNVVKLNLSDKPEGVYFIKVVVNNQAIVKKIIVTK